MLDAQLGWAVGDGRILATRDGGRSWRVQALPEGRESAQLRGIHALDMDHALVVGLAGVRLRTQNAGRLWEDRSEAVRVDVISASAPSPGSPASGPSASPLEISFDADLHDVVCADGSAVRCVSLGAASGVAYSIDRGESWVASRRHSPLPFEPIEMAEGSVELSREAADRIIDLVEKSGGRSNISIRVEAVASAREIEDLSRDPDPEALFETLEARALDAVGILESAGIGAERITIRGTPPWGYDELMDDDPEFLERYWRERRATTAGLRIAVIDERPMHSGRFLDRRVGTGAGEMQQLIAVGADGATWHSLDGGVSWGRADELGDPDLFFLAQDGSHLMLGGDQGMLQVSVDAGEKWERQAWAETRVVEDTLLDLDFSTDSGLGLIVGKAGLILKRGARGEGWKRIVASNF